MTKLADHLDPKIYHCLPESPALLALDFDGVMTDDRVWVAQDGTESVACNRGDGMGVTLLKRTGFPILIISSEPNPVVKARADKLGVDCVHGCRDKTREFETILRERGIDAANVVFVGNDVNDIGCIERVGCGLAVADAHPLVKDAANATLLHRGGHGAVREACELLLVRNGHSLTPGAI